MPLVMHSTMQKVLNISKHLFINTGAIVKTVAFVLLGSCSTIPAPELKNNITYKHDIQLEVNGQKGTGFLIVQPAEIYKVKLKAKARIDLLSFINCHRDITRQAAYEDNGLFSGKKVAKLEIFKNSPIETEYCPYNIVAYDIKGRHSFGLIDFYDENFTLAAKHNCNGSNFTAKGVSVCQGFHGTYQEINLPERSRIKTNKLECKLNLEDSEHFRYEIKKGVCVYAIRGLKSNKYHRLTTIGYEKIIIKEQ